MQRYSAFSLVRNALSGHKNWSKVWRSPEPKPAYDVLIIGGGGHGLATAYYLAKNHGITNVAVLEKGYLGGGNVGRNTTIVRSNYMLPQNNHFYEYSLKLWEKLSRELNYNVMFSPRSIINLVHSDAQRDAAKRRGNAMRLNGIDAQWLDLKALKKKVPLLDLSPKARFPIKGGLCQPRAGTARHDAVAWGYARAADARGIDIIQQCAVTGLLQESDAIVGVETTRGTIRAKKIGVAVAGHTTQLMNMAGLHGLPIESHLLQAMVTEGLKPVLNQVVTSASAHGYISQSDKGGLVFGGDLTFYNSFSAKGSTPTIEHVAADMVSMFPAFSRVRLLRHWGGVMDMSMDGSPIIAKLDKPGLYLNAGWCYGGFKATPASGWCFAHTIAKDAPHPLSQYFTLDRFQKGYTIDERGAGPVPGWH